MRGYRVFMTFVFVCVVAMDEFVDRNLSTAIRDGFVGPASIVVWAMTLLGSFDVGPMAAIWKGLVGEV